MILSTQMISSAQFYLNNQKEIEINLTNRNIEEISNFNATFNYFQSINLADNRIKILTNIPFLDRLKSLNLANNRITRIGRIGQFVPNLQTLFMMNNQVKAVEEVMNLQGCNKLSNLNLCNNPVHEIKEYRSSVIQCLVSLKILDFKKITPKRNKKIV